MTDDRRPASRPTPRRFSVDHWAAFWAAPHPELVGYMVTPDVVSYWPGDSEPVEGVTGYKQRISRILDTVPDLRLEVAEHAARDEVVFIRWIGRGTGPDGGFEVDGIDRLRLRDGLIRENRVYYDPSAF